MKFKKTGDANLDDLICKLLEKKPNKRITWDEYFNHSFFKLNKNDEDKQINELKPNRPIPNPIFL